MAGELTPKTWDAMGAFGFFVVGWSVLESVIEAAIAKQLKLSSLNGSIVTAALQFKGKATLLKTLLARDPEKNAEAISIVNRLLQRGERNDLIHSIIGWEGDSLVFHRRKADGKFKVGKIYHDRRSLMLLALEFTEITSALQRAVGLSDASLINFLHLSHKAAAKGVKSAPPFKSKSDRAPPSSHSSKAIRA